MTPLVRLYCEIGAFTILVGIFYGYNRYEQNIGYQRCEQKIEDAQAIQAAKLINEQKNHQLQTDEAERNADYEKHHLPPVIHSSIILHNGQICTGPVPVLPASISLPTPDGSAEQGSRGRDIRPGIEAFKLRYETALIDCRKTLADWPKEPK